MTKRTPSDIHRILTAVEKAWGENPHLTLYGLLQKLKPESNDSLSDERLCREVNKRYP